MTILPRHFRTGTMAQANPRVAYCFTYNNYTDANIDVLKEWMVANCKYGCFQKEVAPTTGTIHLQGYLSLQKKQRMTTIAKKLGTLGIQLALINANGTPQQNRTYCSKPGGQDFWETGEINIVGQGARNDILEIHDKVKRKRPLDEIVNDHPETFYKYHRGIERAISIFDEAPIKRDMDIVLLFGDSGTGKTTKAEMYAAMYGDYHFVEQPTGQLWFDGYKGQPSIIIDEFKGWIQPTMLNRYLDSRRVRLPIKGSSVFAQYTHVFITSNYPPEEWWSDKVIWCKKALFRRITHIYEFRGNDHMDCTIKKLK